MSDFLGKDKFDAWCIKMGIAPRSHDASVAKASWKEAMRVAMGAMTKAVESNKTKEK